jgi:WD40 repeat protein
VVLLIDQFEELFTLVEDEAVRMHFLNSIITAVTDPHSRVRVIITLRADFYDRPLLYQRFSELIRARTEVVVPLGPEELKAAIVSPAERNGLRVDPELVEAIVADVGEQPGALPLLQYALTEVFEQRSGPTLTLTPYHASGGVFGALGRRAEELYSGLPAQQHADVRQLFLRLVTLGEGVEDTRRRVRRSELIPIGADRHTIDTVIELYSQYRLLLLDHDPVTRAPTVEVAHEALIRTWGRLRQWLDASREDLRLHRRLWAAAAEWSASGGERSFLATGVRLEQLEAWAQETHLALNVEERTYLDASLADRDAQRAREMAGRARLKTLERRSRTFLRALVGVFAMATLLAVGLSLYSFRERQVAVGNERLAQQNANLKATAETRAWKEAANAEQQKVLAQDRALVSAAQAALYKGNSDLARTLGIIAADKPNPVRLAEVTLADAVYGPGTRKVLAGHADVVHSVAYSPDETMVISSGRNDKILILWDLATGKELRRFAGHTDKVRQVVFLPDSKRVLSSSEDSTLILWDVATAKPIRSFKKHANEVKGVALRPFRNLFISACADATLMLWDLDCATPTPQTCDQPVRVFEKGNNGHSQEINQVAITSDGKQALSTSADTSLVLWDIATGQPIRRFEADENGLETRGVAILPGDRLALSSGLDPELKLWDLATGQVIRRFKGHTRPVYDVAVSSDGTRALSGSDDNTMILWDIATGMPITTFYGHGGYIREVVFSKDGRQALSCSGDATIRLWDLENAAELRRLDGQAPIQSMALSPDERYVLGGSSSGTAKLWDAQTGQAIKSFPWHARAIKSVAFSPDGKYLLTGGDKHDGTVILSDLASGQVIRRFTFTAFGVSAVAFTPDGKRAVAGLLAPSADDYSDDPSLDPRLKTIGMILWDVATGEPIHMFPDLKETVSALAISPDGTQVFAATGNTITTWDITSGKQLGSLEGHKAKINSLALTADGKLAISGGLDKTFIVWDVAAGKAQYTSDLQSAEIGAVALSRDGHYAAVSTDSEVLVWDIQSRQLLRHFVGHDAAVWQLAFSADGRIVFSASLDGTIRMWRLDTLLELSSWAKANRYFRALTCEQEQLYGLEPSHC